MQLPGTPSFPLDDRGHLAADLPCLRCGYNLRGLHADTACPECGTAVGRSLRGDLLQFADPAWVTELAVGLNYIVGGIIAMVVLIVVLFVALATLGPSGTDSLTLLYWLGLVPEALNLIGYWKLTAPDPGRIETQEGLTARGVARISAVASFALKLLSLALSHADEIAGAAISQAGQVNAIVLTFAGLLWMRRLALRVPDVGLAKQTAVVMWGLGVAWSLVALVAIGAMFSQVSGVGGRGMLICPGAALLVFFVWWIVLIVRYRARLNRAAAAARATWARGATPAAPNAP